jgi:hypothetical protein
VDKLKDFIVWYHDFLQSRKLKKFLIWYVVVLLGTIVVSTIVAMWAWSSIMKDFA